MLVIHSNLGVKGRNVYVYNVLSVTKFFRQYTISNCLCVITKKSSIQLRSFL